MPESEHENSPVEVKASADVEECPTCFARREKPQAIGLSIYFVSLFSCGTLLPLSVVTAIVIQSLL